METVTMLPLTRVAVCGGTHGNELSGVYLVRELQKNDGGKAEEQGGAAETVSVLKVLSNPRAVQQCRRYMEKDLNRCFTNALLSTPAGKETLYEIVRAQELNALLGPKGSPEAVDLVCDLHNTTSNMGLCFISYSQCNWIGPHIFRHLQREISSMPMRYIHLGGPSSEAYSLESVGKCGFGMEVGPQPHGVVRADIFSAMWDGVRLMLDWIRRFNAGTTFEGGEVEVYTMVKKMDFPRDPETESITATIHPELQDRDFRLLCPGDPLFLSFTGETQRYEGEEPLYPLFVNEAAYYEKGIALWLARMTKMAFPPIRVKAGAE
ncbi:N-acyl-aromatic-L-amino acid amidohydrolase (carboxylate-forming) B-like [Scleropages formosus]|uniref:N-acyl-aromatic-L-amino acid amidohydrolase n=1 Tax=Scleropages formosus TaxID=113540 RepID=A0A8C9TVG7_SCLFO|nr:N-acyl-aromatic-L-amino acid amidohydrolase (carboxylate-forming) B-like [Scleropages formosus]XP_018600480.1 N-acyl-aromatic-L-amino acid amidohydrolase (carboxylate-forming) B-like [Scleropages formosus]